MKKRQIIAALMALLLLLATACQKAVESKPATSAEPTPSEAQAEQPPAPDGEAVPDEASQAPDSGETAIEFPLTGEPMTFTWFKSNEETTVLMDDFSDNAVISHMAELTNVYFDFISPASSLVSEQLSLILASGEYPDVYTGFGTNYAAGDYQSAIDEELIMDIQDDAAEYMPNYMAYLESNPEVNTMVHTQDGALWGVGRVTVNQAPAWGPAVRKDWLDKIGMEIPVTLQDWEAVLTAFVSEGLSDGPLMLLSSGFMGWFGNDYTISSAFDIGTVNTIMGSPYINKDGTAVYTPATEGYRDYLTLMSKWYAKDLILKDFMSTGVVNAESTILDGSMGIFVAMYGSLVNYGDILGTELVGLKLPINGENGQSHLYFEDYLVADNNSVTFSTQAENLEVLMPYFDYWWTDAGRTLCTYGIEGETFQYVDGVPTYTELIYANQTVGVSMGEAFDALTYRMGPIEFDGMSAFNYPEVNQTEVSAIESWRSYDNDYAWPAVSLTATEQETASAYQVQLDTYVGEFTLKAIVGEIDAAAGWDEYMSNLKSLGVDELIAVNQEALTRYLGN